MINPTEKKRNSVFTTNIYIFTNIGSKCFFILFSLCSKKKEKINYNSVSLPNFAMMLQYGIYFHCPFLFQNKEARF